MPAPKGSQFWMARSKHGRNKIYSDPAILSEACFEYFQWCEDHPLYATELVKFQGKATLQDVPKMRAMTIAGLCIFLGISDETLRRYKKDENFYGVIHEAEQIIRTQKFEGASAELLNPNIIARDLGLADKKELKHDGSDMKWEVEIVRPDVEKG